MIRSRRYPYDRSGITARPTLQFYAALPDGTGQIHAGRALLDTGAALCALPRDALSTLGVERAGILRVEYADGSQHDVDAYDVLLTVPEHFSERIRVAATNSDEPLIGRDVMNNWRITFDGPNKQLEVEPVL
jgi:predicted aspartyl protease